MNEKKLMELVNSLFDNGMNQKADRLILVEENHPGSTKVTNARDLGGWGRLPIRDRIRDYVATVEHETRAATFREAIAAVMKHGEIIHRGNLIKRLEAAASSVKDSEDNGPRRT